MIRNFGGVTGVTNQPIGLDIGMSGSSIKSIQRGSSAGTGAGAQTVTFGTTINPNNAIILVNYSYSGTTQTNDCATSLIGVVNLTATTFQWASTDTNLTLNYTIIEYNGVKSKQVGTNVFPSSGATSQTATVTAVDPAKSILVYNISYQVTQGLAKEAAQGVVLTNGTTITFRRADTAAAQNQYWQLLEFN